MVVNIMKKIYKFSYGNFLNFLFSQIMYFIFNASAFLIVAVPIGYIYGELEYQLGENSILFKIITILMMSILVLYTLMLCIYFFLPKRVILKSDIIKIKRYMWNLGYIFRGFNDKLLIKNIVDCKMHDGYRYHLYRCAPYAVFFFNWDDLVDIKTKNNKHYLVPVENSEEFIKEVNARIRIIKVFERYGINSVLAEKGLKPDEIKIRWKSQDEIEQIYYNDKNGNKIEIPLRDE